VLSVMPGVCEGCEIVRNSCELVELCVGGVESVVLRGEVIGVISGG